MRLLANSPFNLDLALRTLSAGWFEPRDVIPVTLVEIDDATNRQWGSPAVTPRKPLVDLLQTIARAQPLAIIVDIDLAWGGVDPDLPALRNYLAAYQGPAPLIFPKRIEPAPGGNRSVAASPLDDVFAGNARLAWAHASFESDGGGVVRQWTDWVEVCTTEGTTLLASIPARLSLLLDPLPRGLRRASSPPLQDSCRRENDPPGQLLLIGPRLTGPARLGLTADAASISAATVLDQDMDRDDAWFFGNRVVLVGATHPASGDFWLTPSGVLPGVELLAHTVRLAPLRDEPGRGAGFKHRAAVLVGFRFIRLYWPHVAGAGGGGCLCGGRLAVRRGAHLVVGVLPHIRGARGCRPACRHLQVCSGRVRHDRSLEDRASDAARGLAQWPRHVLGDLPQAPFGRGHR